MEIELRIFLSCIYGEAANSSPASWKAIASCILNRVGKREWKKHDTALKVIANTGFDAFEHENDPYQMAMDHLKRNPSGMGALARLVETVTPLYEGGEAPIPHLVLYFSPKAQAALHAKHPEKWPAFPSWNFKVLERIYVPGTEGDDFAWFRYKEGA
jgi:hypothetical protein